MSIHVDLKTTFHNNEDEPDDFVTTYEGKIHTYDEQAREVIVGTAKAFVVDVESATDNDMSVWDVFDSRTETADYYALYSEREAGNLSRAVMKLLGEDFAMHYNLLIIDRIEIPARHRGNRYGLLAMRALVRHLRLGCRIAAIKPFPLQFESDAHRHKDKSETSPWFRSMKFQDLDTNEARATRRLRQHYAQLGFRPVPKTPLMVFDLEGGRLPDLEGG